MSGTGGEGLCDGTEWFQRKLARLAEDTCSLCVYVLVREREKEQKIFVTESFAGITTIIDCIHAEERVEREIGRKNRV